MTFNLALIIAYNGNAYAGWQKQPTVITVQECVERSIARVADHPVVVYCAGRTDAGVHAQYQVVHFSTVAQRTDRQWFFGINSYLPRDIRVHGVTHMESAFHARFSALSRQYLYAIDNGVVACVFEQSMAWHIAKPLNIEAMQQASKCLLGEQDFQAFRSSQCQSHSSKRCLIKADIFLKGRCVFLRFTANAFLHHMVRNLVGSLVEVGLNRKPVVWLQELLHSKDRKQAGATAPARGLCLTFVRYPERFLLPMVQTNRWTDYEF